jgi:UDP-2,3-diacylglucosamine pyrophosphatase LpxH
MLVLKKLRKNRILSKKNKSRCKKAVKHISDFEETATELAIEKTDYVICGHIHE